MRSDFGRGLTRWLFMCAAVVLLAAGEGVVQAQDDGSTLILDGGGDGVLQSIFVPYMAHAPFSLTLATEWVRPLNNGGTFAIVNSRPIKRDSAGRLYMERWLLTPKGSNIPLKMSWIQIADPLTHTLCQCNVPQKVCELLTLRDTTSLRFRPELIKTEPLPNGKGTRTHEDLGPQYFAGLPVHEYRDTTTLNAGVLGNDMPMSTVRQYRFSAELGINLTSTLDSAQSDRQIFTVTEISTTEPDPSFFQPPQGYQIVDHRKAAAPAK